ncbi:hypothetical protein DL765_007920 [Monosporascus sp. GIB2]|nr:hypothetical protein DL765_007920 [Monosporascus sp. GIB2]
MLYVPPLRFCGITLINCGDIVERLEDVDLLHPDKSRQEAAVLKALQDERDYIASLEANDGNGKSLKNNNHCDIVIDEADQSKEKTAGFRGGDLIRLTGKSPMKAELPLTLLLDVGLITRNDLHYVRNQGSVSRFAWVGNSRGRRDESKRRDQDSGPETRGWGWGSLETVLRGKEVENQEDEFAVRTISAWGAPVQTPSSDVILRSSAWLSLSALPFLHRRAGGQEEGDYPSRTPSSHV